MKPGLREVRAATPEGRCPFCPRPLATPHPRGGQSPTTCKAKRCKLAEVAHYSRDYRRDERRRNAQRFAA